MRGRGKILLSLIVAMVLSIAAFGGSLLSAAAEDAPNLTTDAANWSADKSIGFGGASFDADGIKMTEQTSAIYLTNKIAKNSKVEIVFDGHATSAGWGNLCVMFKAADGVSADAGLFAKAEGNYLALKFGTDGAMILESTDGVVTTADKSNALTDPEAMSGFDFWYAYKQVTTITIETTDTASGVNVKISFLASGDLENLTGKTYTLTYSSVNPALAGDYNLSVGAFWEKKDAEYIGVRSVTVAAAEAGGTAAESVDDMILALPDSVTQENYAAAKSAIQAARAAYEALTAEEKAQVSQLDKLTAAEQALQAYEQSQTSGPNLATDAANWSADKSIGFGGASFDADGIKMTEQTSALYLNEKIAKNSKVEIVFDGHATSAAWGNLCVMFKAADGVSADAALFARGEGNYLALKFGADGTMILESTDGVLKTADKGNAATDPEALSGFDFWYAYKQITTITIETTDTPSGVNVKISFLASGDLENLTGKTYTLTYASVNPALAGDYNLSVGAFWDRKDGEYIGVRSVTVAAAEAGGTAASVDNMILALPDSVTQENYATVKAEILAARNAYESLEDGEKANVTQLDRLVAAEASLQEYEAALAAQPINEQIAALATQVDGSNYAAAKIAYMAALYKYEGLEAAIQSKVDISALEAAEAALVSYEDSEEGKSVNLATDVAYWQGGVNPICFSFDERGMGLWDAQGGAMVSNQTIPANSSIYLDVNGTQTNGQYGNLYVVFKSDAKRNVFNGSVTPVEEGNYLVFMLGGDGCKIYDCKNGVVTVETFDAADNLDAWYFYKQRLSLMITTQDTATGVDVTIEFVGPSGKVTHKEYQCDNPALQGESYLSVELFLSAGGTGYDWVNIRQLRVIGMETAFIPDIDVAALNAQAEALAGTTLTQSNVDQVREDLQALKEAQSQMNYPQSTEFNASMIAQIEGKLAAYETNLASAAAVDEQIDGLPAQVDANNYSTAKSAIEAARAAYDALSAEAKALVTKLSQMEAAEQSLQAYEDSQAGDTDAEAVDALIGALPAQITADNYEEAKTAIEAARAAYDALDEDAKAQVTKLSQLEAAEQAMQEYEDGSDSGETGGCGGNVSACAAGISAMAIVAAAAWVFRKKKAA